LGIEGLAIVDWGLRIDQDCGLGIWDSDKDTSLKLNLWRAAGAPGYSWRSAASASSRAARRAGTRLAAAATRASRRHAAASVAGSLGWRPNSSDGVAATRP